MDDIDALTQHLDFLFLRGIVLGLRNGKITVEKARQYAIEFLALQPFSSMSDAYIKSTEFITKYPEFIQLKEYLDVFEKEKDVPGKINKMREHMKQNNIEAAIQVAKS